MNWSIRRRTALSVASVVIISTAVGAPSTLAATTSSSSACTPYVGISAVDKLSPTLTAATSSLPAAVLNDDEPTIYTFDYGEGTHLSEKIPPKSWRPLKATAAELKYYGIPARPTADDSDVASWVTEWDEDYTETVPVDLCSGKPGGIKYSDRSPTWAGLVTDGSTDFSEAYTSINVPYTQDQCNSGYPAVFDAWTGIGGNVAATDNLMQNGISIGDPFAPTTGMTPFYEFIRAGSNNTFPPVYVYNASNNSGYVISSGDQLNMSTTYYGSSVHFGWHDLTNGHNFGVDASSYGGYPMSYFYTGKTAEFIDEHVDPAHNDARYFDDVTWTSMHVKRTSNQSSTAPGALPHHGLYAQPNSSGSKTIALKPDAMLSGSSIRTHWLTCYS